VVEVITSLKQTRGQRKASEEINLTVKHSAQLNTLLISGERRMFPEAGGETGKALPVYQWYFFDGARYQPIKSP
jgi:hypothetical protein